jgi:hypothetical protein
MYIAKHYYSNPVEESGMAGKCSTHVKDADVQLTFLVSKHEGKKPLAIPRRKWKDNIKLGLKETLWKVC